MTYPLSHVIKIIKVIKKKYRDKMTYNIWYNSIVITITNPETVDYYTFSFNEVLKWYNDPVRLFEEARRKRL